MAGETDRRHPLPLHPLHAILLAFPVALFTGALLSDLAYSSSYQVQWANFSSWLIAGGLAVGALALLWALIDLIRSGRRKGVAVAYFAVLLLALLVGFVNALVHARDAWASMPAGLVLSAVAALLALIAAWLGYSGVRTAEGRP